jgi:hypothetical protein
VTPPRESPTALRASGARALHVALRLALLAGLAGCLRQQTLDRKLYRVDGPDSSNYYRVTLRSQTFWSDVQYEAGLYPSYAVEAYLGQQGSLSSSVADAGERLRAMVAEAQVEAVRAYLQAEDGAPARAAAERVRRLQRIPLVSAGGLADPADPGGEYGLLESNPVLGLADFAANQRYVVALASDPGAVLAQLDALQEEAETKRALEQAVAGVLVDAAGVDLDRLDADRRRRAEVAAELEALARSDDDAQLDTTAGLRRRLDQARAQLERLP